MSCTLYSLRRNGVHLAEALHGVAAGVVLAGLCHSPMRAFFVRWDGGALAPGDGGDLAQVYEARLFAESGELRWLRDPEDAGGRGDAVWLSESPVDRAGWLPLDPLAGLTVIAGRRLLTGVLGEPRESGWSGMHAPRHGEVAVPAVGAAGERLCLISREYLGAAPGTAGEDGNDLVVEERLLAIAVCNTTGGQ
ncbi:CRISPR-associated protein Csx19 [Accumulibacter sp.]|uniref:type III-D CRISPR-associated protein Csx19 n=1 Tax=Accumulibacter sp. TaxID=2053492 RepID=UPI0035ADC10F